jgi:hypothetical protein
VRDQLDDYLVRRTRRRQVEHCVGKSLDGSPNSRTTECEWECVRSIRDEGKAAVERCQEALAASRSLALVVFDGVAELLLGVVLTLLTLQGLAKDARPERERVAAVDGEALRATAMPAAGDGLSMR